MEAEKSITMQISSSHSSLIKRKVEHVETDLSKEPDVKKVKLAEENYEDPLAEASVNHIDTDDDSEEDSDEEILAADVSCESNNNQAPRNGRENVVREEAKEKTDKQKAKCKKKRQKYVLRCHVTLKQIACNILLEMKLIGANESRENLHQVLQYFKNHLT